MSDRVDKEIRKYLLENPSTDYVSNYWYPLSRPSFGSEEIIEAVESMLTFRTTMWEKTRLFEELFSDYVGAESVMVNSGSSADLLLVYSMLSTSGGALNPGDEVLVPAVTWPTHLWSVAMAGLVPVLVDVDPKSLNMDINDLRTKISSRSKAIFPVHLMGNPANLTEIQAIAAGAGLIVLEDCCESLGAFWNGRHVGSQSYGGTFSFFFSHHICTMEGGMIVTSDPETAERLRLLRAHGWARNLKNRSHPLLKLTEDPALDSRYTFLEWGFNVRPTELQAGFGLHQIKKFPQFKRARNQTFAYIREDLKDLSDIIHFPEVNPQAEACWLALPIMLNSNAPTSRNEVTKKLQSLGIETRPIVAGNLTKQPVSRRFDWLREGNLPGASAIHDRGFYVGLHSRFHEDEIVRITATLRSVLSAA
jgi:CDP-6-deoxy-D-xylo-4-hexulose-3-dehydrase